MTDAIERPVYHTYSEVEPLDAIEVWNLGFPLDGRECVRQMPSSDSLTAKSSRAAKTSSPLNVS